MGKKIGLLFSALCLIAAVVFVLFSDEIAGKGNATVTNTMMVTDSTGRQVSVPLKPKRVVILNASNVDLFVAAGGAGSIVGMTTSQALSEEVKQATANAENVGMIHSPNMEKIISLHPDLVIGVNVPFHVNLIPTLEKAGIPLILNDVSDYDKIETSLKLFGDITGNSQRAEERFKAINKEYIGIIDSMKDKKPLRSVVIFGNPQSFSLATNKTFTGDMIKRLGGINIADGVNSGDSPYIPLSMEFLAKENPEVIMIIMMGPPETMQEKIKTELETNPAWRSTDAVKNGKVYILPYNLFTVNPGVQCIDAMKILQGYIY